MYIFYLDKQVENHMLSYHIYVKHYDLYICIYIYINNFVIMINPKIIVGCGALNVKYN